MPNLIFRYLQIRMPQYFLTQLPVKLLRAGLANEAKSLYIP